MGHPKLLKNQKNLPLYELINKPYLKNKVNNSKTIHQWELKEQNLILTCIKKDNAVLIEGI